MPEAGVSGPDVREVIPLPVAAGQDRATYRVLCQNPVYGGSEAAFTVALELPLGAGGKAALPDLRVPRRAGGGRAFLLVENASSGEMTLDPRGLDPAIEKDVPFLPAQIVAGTRFFRVAPGVPWSLGIAVANLEKTAGRAALVAYAELTSTLRADGEEWHRATYRLQNRRLQFLPVELPPGVEFIGARVAGESVRVDAAGRTSTALLVPLAQDAARRVVLRRGTGLPPSRARAARPARRTWGRWQLDDPTPAGHPRGKNALERVPARGHPPARAAAATSSRSWPPSHETEKLESALSDLRSLSATYQSASATRQEQQLALNNFNTLAADVKSKAQVQNRSRLSETKTRRPRCSKNPTPPARTLSVSLKQRSIQNELDSLSAANNVAAQQAPQADGGFFDRPGRSPTMSTAVFRCAAQGHRGWLRWQHRLRQSDQSVGQQLRGVGPVARKLARQPHRSIKTGRANSTSRCTESQKGAPVNAKRATRAQRFRRGGPARVAERAHEGHQHGPGRGRLASPMAGNF